MLDYLLHLLTFTNSIFHCSGYPELNIVYTFTLIPILDQVLPRASIPPRKSNLYFDVLLLVYYPLIIICFLKTQNTLIDYFSLGIIYGQGINVAHELIHKRGFNKGIGICTLYFLCYGHWYYQHTKGHHINVGLEKDPATAPRDMTVYQFIPRCIYGEFSQAWDIDKGKTLYSMLFSGFLLLILKNGFCHLVACIIGIVFLQIINYVEHYGATRKIDEKVTTLHSWDSDSVFSTYALFKLPYHADHHTNAIKPYRELELKEKSRKLPFGYPAMMIISLIPPLFFRLIHPILEQ